MKTKRSIRTRGRKVRLFGGLLILIASFFVARMNFTSAADLADLDPKDWKLELVFFDSTVEGGKKPLQSVNWTIAGEDLAFNLSQKRTITMQVNYKNAQVDRTYEPGKPQSEPQPETPNTYDAGVKVFFVVGGALVSLTILAGASIKRNIRKQ